jgi:hypothetical protein
MKLHIHATNTSIGDEYTRKEEVVEEFDWSLPVDEKFTLEL